MFLDGAKLHQPGRILLPVSSSRTGCPIARSAEELSSTWPSPADITVDLDHRPNWTERIVALRLRPTVGDLRLGGLRQDPGRAAESAAGPERTKTRGHDVRVLLSTYGGRGDEPLVGLAVRLRALGAEVRVCAPPDWAERPADSSEGRQREMRTCPTRGSTELEAPVIRSASAVQRSTAASEVSR